MAQAPARTTGMFSTHRGQFVKRVSLGLFAFSFGLMMLNGILNGPTPEQEAAAAAAEANPNGEVVRAEPDIAPAPVDPFAAQKKVESLVAPETGTDENSLFQTAISTAGTGATQYATYSHQQTPDAYVDLISGMAPEASKALREAAKTNWAEIEAQQITSKSAIRGTQPQVIAFDAEKGTAAVTVTVAQSVTSRDREYLFSKSYLVHLQRTSDDKAQWEIISIGSS